MLSLYNSVGLSGWLPCLSMIYLVIYSAGGGVGGPCFRNRVTFGKLYTCLITACSADHLIQVSQQFFVFCGGACGHISEGVYFY